MLLQNTLSIKWFHKIIFCKSLGINLSIDRDACSNTVAYIWIFSDPVKAGLTVEGGVVVVIKMGYKNLSRYNFPLNWRRNLSIYKFRGSLKILKLDEQLTNEYNFFLSKSLIKLMFLIYNELPFLQLDAWKKRKQRKNKYTKLRE